MSNPIKILLAEDEVSLGIIIKESLESRNFLVNFCGDGEAAFKAYQVDPPDMLVLDVMMPKKDGFTLGRMIRQQNPTVPILFLTAKSRPQDVVEGFGNGANDYIKKPFSMEELIVRIKALVSRPLPVLPKESWIPIGDYQFNLTKQVLRLNQ